jgi:hypothetical protein
MITRRYTKLFQSLNKALETRVKELDRPAMHLADIRKKMIFDKHKDDSSALFSISEEALSLILTALSGRLKQKTRDAIWTLAESVWEERSYSEEVDSILVKNENAPSGNIDQQYIPAIYSVTESLLNPDDTIESVYTARTDVWQNTTPVVSEINRINSSLNWMPLDNEEKASIRKEFISLCEKEPSSDAEGERITKEMIRLFDESAWEDCKNELQ